MAQTLLLVRLGDAANVLLEGGKVQAGAGGHKSLFGDFEAGVELPGELPGQRVEDRIRLRISPRAVTAAFMRRFGTSTNCASATMPVRRSRSCHDDRIGVQRLGQLERTGARGVKALRQPRWSRAYMRSARLMGAKPAEARRLLKISAEASRIHSRLGWPVRLSKGSTSRMRPCPPVAGPTSAALWARAQTVMQRASAVPSPRTAASCLTRPERDEENVCTTR